MPRFLKDFRTNQAHTLLGELYAISIHKTNGDLIPGTKPTVAYRPRIEEVNGNPTLIFGNPVSFVVPANETIGSIKVELIGEGIVLEEQVNLTKPTNDLFYVEKIGISFLGGA